MNLHEITSTIRAANGEVMALGPTSFGFVIRASIIGKSCRIITLRAGQKTTYIPSEPGCQTHVASDVESLKTWLHSLSKSTSKEAEIIF